MATGATFSLMPPTSIAEAVRRGVKSVGASLLQLR